MSVPIVAHPAGETKPDSLGEPQSFTIECAMCDEPEPGSHLPHCPGVIAAGYDTAGAGAFSSVVYPEAGQSFGRHASAFGALRFYSIWGPVELRLADGRVFGVDDLDR